LEKEINEFSVVVVVVATAVVVVDVLYR